MLERGYELTGHDLREVQVQVLAARRQAMWASPVRFAGVMAVAGLVCWPIWGALLGRGLLHAPTPRVLTGYLLLIGAAAALAQLFGRLLPNRGSRLDGWAAGRMARAAAPKSALGPVTVRLDDSGLWRQNGRGELRVSAAEIQDVLRSRFGLTVRLRGSSRVIPLPARAHADAAARVDFEEALKTQLGIAFVELDGPTPGGKPGARAPRRARPWLLASLGYLALVLAVQQGAWRYYDPRPQNPEGQVVVYATSWCPACARLRACLDAHRVPFEERDIERSTRGRGEWEVLGGTGIPVTLVGARVVYGMDPGALEPALADAGFSVDCSQ